MAEGMFIAGDWGTTRLRLALCDSTKTLAWTFGPGISALAETPEKTFLALTEAWRIDHGPLPAFLCGMVGARIGWREAPYAPCPGSPETLRAMAVRFVADDCSIAIAPGLTCTNPLGAPDVMRGEETQIFGAIAAFPQLSQGRYLLGLPGTHSKWAELIDGRIRFFMTTPTGEFFALLRKHSTLTRAATVAGEGDDVGSSVGFSQGIARQHTTAGKAGLLQTLFEVRTRQLIDGMSPEDATGFLSGLLIGADVAGALQCFGAYDAVYLIGDPRLSQLYAQALIHAGVESSALDGTDCAFQGLRTVFTDDVRV